jgi:hypothetical protein
MYLKSNDQHNSGNLIFSYMDAFEWYNEELGKIMTTPNYCFLTTLKIFYAASESIFSLPFLF